MAQDLGNGKPLWTAEETAKILACSVQHVLRLALLGEIPAVDLAPPRSRHRMWRFRPDALTSWINERERGSLSGRRR